MGPLIKQLCGTVEENSLFLVWAFPLSTTQPRAAKARQLTLRLSTIITSSHCSLRIGAGKWRAAAASPQQQQAVTPHCFTVYSETSLAGPGLCCGAGLPAAPPGQGLYLIRPIYIFVAPSTDFYIVLTPDCNFKQLSRTQNIYPQGMPCRRIGFPKLPHNNTVSWEIDRLTPLWFRFSFIWH